MLKTAFVMPARDKLHGIKLAVESMLNQTYSPMELVFSDHGSKDGTRQVIEAMCAKYDGPNTIRILDCPHTEQSGMTGLNRHIDWIMSQLDADIIIQCSADDVNEIHRAERIVPLFEETGAAMVNSGMQFLHINGDVMETDYPTQTQFVTGAECLMRLVGGSTAPAWRHDFYDRIGGLHGPVVPDVYMPFLATQDSGLYYLHEVLYALIRWPDDKNTGLGGRQLAAKGEVEKLKLGELVQYQLASTFSQLYKTCQRLYPGTKDEDKGALCSYILGTAGLWSELRDQMTEQRIQPDCLPT